MHDLKNDEISRYINRELSWLEFNHRVLEQAQDPDVPLLERLKFLAITSSNLDEFFMVRVGGLKMLADSGSSKRDPNGLSAIEQLQAIHARFTQMLADQYACYMQALEPALAAAGVRRRRPGELTERQTQVIGQVFDNEIHAILTPMAVTCPADFPLLPGRALNLCVRLDPAPAEPDRPRFAVIPIGRTVSRFITLPSDGGYDYMLLEDVIGVFIQRFFPGERIQECTPFRITRNADMSVREDLAFDLLEEMEQILDARRHSACVRLELADTASDHARSFLQEVLDVDGMNLCRVPGPLDLSAFMRLTDLKGFSSLRYEDWPAQPSPEINTKASMFEAIAQQDLLLCHPFESFDPVVRLIDEAAEDPDVLAIKQILYRTSRNSPIVAALKRAAQRGKHVTALVELKARFDEARNIEWARNLEQADVQVIYGVKGLKTHAKLCLIVRREPHGIQRYVHFGTGNYNEITARQYTDVSYMTCNDELAADANSFLCAITGYSQPQRFRRIEAAPIGLRETLLEMIQLEIACKRQGQKAHIMAKMNSLADPRIIDALYEASRAGVKIQLNIRGTCCLRPGIPRLSKNISVVSIVDRYLEHSRIFYFCQGGDERVFISSADWMPRNLDRRVELLVPVDDPACRDRLIAILQVCLRDNVNGWRLGPDGTYERLRPEQDKPAIHSQEILYRAAMEVAAQGQQSPRTMFEPHRAPEAET